MNAPQPETPRSAELPVADLVLDPRLQARLTVSDAAVSDYADALTAGAVFPPISVVVLHDGVSLVTDGWHRVKAHIQAGRSHIAALVAKGTRRDALLAAVQANANHGLQRSQEDKRRAVRLLLMEPEWSDQSNRELARLAAVSHTFVAQVRSHYGVERGSPLTDARVEHIDGEPPEAWRALFEEAEAWERAPLQQIRKTESPLELAAERGGALQARARQLRTEELATPWPWREDLDAEAMRKRAAELDSLADLEAALRCPDCPDRPELIRVARAARDLEARPSEYSLARLMKTVEGRKRLVTLAHRQADALARRKAKEPADPWLLAHAITAMPAATQAEAIQAAPDEVLDKLRIGEMDPSVRDGALRDRVGSAGSCVRWRGRCWLPWGSRSCLCRWWAQTCSSASTPRSCRALPAATTTGSPCPSTCRPTTASAISSTRPGPAPMTTTCRSPLPGAPRSWPWLCWAAWSSCRRGRGTPSPKPTPWARSPC